MIHLRFGGSRGGDLAAQDAWAGFATRHGGSAYNLFWYGGTHTANYSLISPYLMAALGVRTVSVLAGVAATWLAAVLITRVEGLRRPLGPALLASFALWCNVASGRTPWLRVDGVGCLAPRGEFTRLTVSAPGDYRLSSEYGPSPGPESHC